MNIFLHELRAYRRSTIIWTVALAALIMLFMMLFPAFTKDVAETKKIIGGLPQAVRDALGIQLTDFFTIFGFYAYLFSFVVLTGAIQAMNLGTSIISKEDSGKTAEFLLTKPVTRPQVMTAKLLAALTTLAFTNVVYLFAAGTAAGAAAKEPFSMKIFIMVSLTLFFVQLMFLALGVLVSVIMPKIKSVIAVSLPVVFAFFIIGVIGSILDNEASRYASPFKYYDTPYIVKHGAYEWRFIVIEIIFVIVAVAASYVIFAKKDIRAAS
ncbi:MAG: ABC transporter permease subunit [Actinomycetota bacterium]|nr:ABC transporter permease subunit [Actinomycetota bacterium]